MARKERNDGDSSLRTRCAGREKTTETPETPETLGAAVEVSGVSGVSAEGQTPDVAKTEERLRDIQEHWKRRLPQNGQGVAW